MRVLLGVLFFSISSFGLDFLMGPFRPFAGPTQLSFVTGAQNAAREVWKGIDACGLEVRNAYDPALPRPQIIALSAIVAGGRVVAYYNEEDLGTSLVWKAPNGGYRFRISFAENQIAFTTPLAGQVAWANRYFDPQGMKFNYWLRGVAGPVAYSVWHDGVQRGFIQQLVNELCRYSTGARPPEKSDVPKL